MNRKPPELHIVDGTTSRRGNSFQLPESIRKRVPEAEWMNDPDAWDRNRFVAETSEFLFTVYGIGNDQDKHTLAMLADQIDLYVKCSKGIDKNGVVTTYNDGKTIGANPYIAVRNKALTLIIQLMNEMGLTPRSRLAAGKVESESIASKFLKSPFKQ
jgi:P27 family predicted phage terminase small subunit